jgi:two-component system, chemotaxis family, chemotaxis protein CheY
MSTPLGAMGIGRAAINEAQARPPRPVQTHPLARAPRPRTCLIVDDSRVVRKVSRPMIESFGYSVIEAEDGQEALARCKVDMPGLVMLDWDMPVMTGIQFVAQLRALDAAHRPYVVFCTSRSDTQDIFKGMEAGADEYVTKPFTHASLRAKLERIGAV